MPRLPFRKCEFAAMSARAASATAAAPSGLFGRAAFERDLLERSPRRPSWWADPQARDARYRAWVQAEAGGMVAQLGRLELAAAESAVAAGVRRLMAACAEDMAWAEAGSAGHDTEARRDAA